MIDLAIVLAFVAYAVTSGFLSREQASKGLDEYFLAGKSRLGVMSLVSTAAAVGEDPGVPVRRLGRGLGATGLTALSLFLLLAGVGRLLVPAPGASFEISVGLAAGGLVLVPVWWPAVKRRTSRLGLGREG